MNRSDAARSPARMRKLQKWLWGTQTWSRDRMRSYQFAHMQEVLRHAVTTVPFYGEHYAAETAEFLEEPSEANWAKLPLLTRRDIQEAGDGLVSTAVPPSHGAVYTTRTGGSTGQPVVTKGTQRTAYAWQALAIRDHLWHQRDFSAKLASIRHTRSGIADPPAGRRCENWGSSVAPFLKTGPGVVLTVDSTTEQQADWIQRENPGYLFGYPSCILALARYSATKPLQVTNLREVRTFGEIVEPVVREVCRKVWDVELVDLYSTQEVGYIALQCPENESYHVQEENVFVEVIDAEGKPCRPGDIGKVVVTALHNYATPLLRYDLGDFAQVGEACGCGRTMLVLERILGRQRNMLVLPNGDQIWPSLSLDRGQAAVEELTSIHQMQVIQTSLQNIEIKLVAREQLRATGEERLLQFVRDCLPGEFSVSLRYVDSIPRSPRRKFEDFRSEVAVGS